MTLGIIRYKIFKIKAPHFISKNFTEGCIGLSVFWMSNVANYFNDNAAVGGEAGIWAFTHSGSDNYKYDAFPEGPVY